MDNNLKRLIFIVDDDPISRRILKFQLSNNSRLVVRVFSSAEECLANLYQNPNLVVLDYNLNGNDGSNMSGHQALGVIQKINPKIKIIFVSGDQNFDLLSLYRKYRSIQFVIKDGYGSLLLKPIVLKTLGYQAALV